MLIVLVSLIYVALGESLFQTDDSEGNLQMKKKILDFSQVLYRVIVKAIKNTYIVNTI